MNNIRSIDMNLLGIFSVLRNAQNLTHAAEELGMTQSAVSHALKRLRTLYNDPLFVRKGGKMLPTSKAESIYPLVNQILLDVQSTLPSKEVTTPENLHFEYRVNMVNVDSNLFMQKFVVHLQKIAPNIKIKQTYDLLNDPAQSLRNREYDLHIDLLKLKETGCHYKQVFSDRLSVYCAKNHPRLSDKKELSLTEYLAEKHAVFIPSNTKASTLSTITDFNHERKVGYESQSMSDMLQITSMTELICIMPTSMMETLPHKEKYHLIQAPFIELKASCYMNWYWGVEHYASHRWLRQELLKAAAEN